jgi:Na+-driven multidrug efflux pump
MLGFFLIAKGQPMRLLFLGAIGLSVNIVCNFILIPRLGAPGGAWATVATEASMCAGLIILYQSRT